MGMANPEKCMGLGQWKWWSYTVTGCFYNSIYAKNDRSGPPCTN